jgi:Xaa-Pro aminopeptidase
MVCSNEPGYYEDGRFGIRVENLVIVEEANTEFRWVGGGYGGVWRLWSSFHAALAEVS